ncbi:protein FAM43B-like [Denticeps clupeoides]|uniref:protein FAM43B-like n=1 Tax=Denticeps clupeoides TaxID=299321 RepID=UPI0010A4AF89|nr:protein FAM43B-like [Denticeps clupeoides]
MRPDESGAREEGGGAIGSPLSVSLRHSVSSSPPCSTLRLAMLPWRKSKFVLVEDEAASKPKSPGAGLTCHALLSSLLHSCPYLLPDCPLRWLGGVFRSRRHKVELNRDQPVYSVRYLGSAVTIAAKGDGCTQDAVAKIWARSDYGEQSVKTKLSVGPHGVRVGKTPGHLYSLNRVTYCAADPHRPKIFAWIYRHQVKNKAVVLRCHAVLLARAEKARALAASLLQNAAAALSEFKRLKRRSDFRHCRQQLLGEGAVPLVPLRRLLNGQCHYRPPDDRPSAAGRLCPIAEEEEEEEEEPGRDLSCSDNGRSCEATPDPATPPFPPPGSCGRILKTAGSI